jgi:hypothetical protein
LKAAALALALCFAAGAAWAQPAPGQLPRAPKPREVFIERVPLPNEALPEEERRKELPAPEPEKAAIELPAALEAALGWGATGVVVALLGTLLAAIIVLALARMVLRRTVRHATTGLVLSADAAEGTVNEHVAEAMAEVAAESAAPPQYAAPPPPRPGEMEAHHRIAAAVPELSVHPKVALSALLDLAGDPEAPRLSRFLLDFVVLRRDGVVVSVVMLEPPVMPAMEAARIAMALDVAGYHVVRLPLGSLPDAEPLRRMLVAPREVEPVPPVDAADPLRGAAV